jgi:FkbM family methyltransferase
MHARLGEGYMRRRADICSIALGGSPLFPGKVRMTNALARIAAITSAGWGTCSLGDGATIRVNLNDRIERQMWGGCYEPHVQQCLRVLLSPGDVFIDIGAHIGYHAVLGASLVRSSGAVFAFEADPENFARLRDHLRPFPWGTPVNKAVCSSSVSVVFERSSQPGESGWGTLTIVRDLESGDHFVVETLSLDEWSSKSGVGSVSAMKIDAEGSEVSILRGGERFLRRMRPAVIIEANDVLLRQAQTSALELTEILRGTAYELYELDGAFLKLLLPGLSPRRNELLGVPSERAKATLELFQRSGFRIEDQRSIHGKIQ